MRKNIYGILILCVIPFFNSCISYVSFIKSYPPEISLNANEKKLALVNFYDYTKLDYSNDRKKEVFISGLNQLTGGLAGSFRNDPTYELIKGDSLIPGRLNIYLPSPLSADSAIFFCNKYKVPLLLALEAFDVYFDKEIEVEEDEEGNKSRTAYYTLNVRAGFTLYDSTGRVIDRSYVERSQPHGGGRPVVLRIVSVAPSFGKAGDAINFLAGKAGRSYVDKFYPGEMPVSRSVHNNKPFKEITPLLKANEWDKAIIKLKELAKSKDAKTAQYAAENLAVAYEALGNEEAVNYWQERAKQKY